MFTRVSLLLCLATVSNGFVVPSSSSSATSTELGASRRDFLGGATAALLGAAIVAPSPAEASYSAYTAREKDWEQRSSKGEIKVSNARDLRKQLSEFVPENDDRRSKIFCPNGASSAVSPLMENKCSDTLMAIPSVYGRSQDIAGNSIPGFREGYLTTTAGAASLSATTGGFPKY